MLEILENGIWFVTGIVACYIVYSGYCSEFHITDISKYIKDFDSGHSGYLASNKIKISKTAPMPPGAADKLYKKLTELDE